MRKGVVEVKKMQIILVVLVSLVVLLASPILINSIIKSGPWFGIEAASNNDWIGFLGDYFGGIITALSLAITIWYTTWQYRDHDRKRIQPYVTFEQLHKNVFRDDTKEVKEFKIGITGYFGGEQNTNSGFLFNNLEFYGMISNIGIGTAINIKLVDFSIENKNLEFDSNTIRSLSVNESVYFRFDGSGIYIKDDELSPEIKGILAESESGQRKIARMKFSFVVTYNDMLGNKYNQNVLVELQIMNHTRNTSEANPVFKDISFPVTITGK